MRTGSNTPMGAQLGKQAAGQCSGSRRRGSFRSRVSIVPVQRTLVAAWLAGACATLALGVCAAPAAATTYTQTTLPFGGLNFPLGVAVDPAGDVFVANPKNAQVLELPKGGSQITLPFSGLDAPYQLAADPTGDVFVSDPGNLRVVELPKGASSQTTVFKSGYPYAVAVDSAGDLFVTDLDAEQVYELPSGSSSPITLPFTGLNYPSAVGVDAAGDVFVVDHYNNRVLELPKGASSPITLPFTGLNIPYGMAVDAAGDVYVVDTGNGRVLELPKGASAPITLPFTGLNGPHDVAVDAAGNVYVSDSSNNRVVELSPHYPTALAADPQLVLFPPPPGVGPFTVAATLTSDGSPAAGQTIAFSTDGTALCSAVTNAGGTASCDPGLVGELEVLLNGAYTATFAASGNLLGSSASTSAIEVGSGLASTASANGHRTQTVGALTRDGKLYALIISHEHGDKLSLRLSRHRRLRAGRYVLTLRAGGHEVRKTISIR